MVAVVTATWRRGKGGVQATASLWVLLSVQSGFRALPVHFRSQYLLYVIVRDDEFNEMKAENLNDLIQIHQLLRFRNR